jgi:TPR repeat protein
MSESGDFALAQRPPSALERAGPGAKRIVCGMVAEVLVLARREASELEAIYQQGVEHEKRGQENQAFGFYRRAAERGHLRAQYKLGQCYLYGAGVGGDEGQGLVWLKRALDGGLGRAGFVLGNHFYHRLVPNYHEAMKYFQKAVDLGDQPSILNLATVREKLGESGKAGETAAVQRAAEDGDPTACFEMGTRCLEGIGMPQSATQAFLWFRQAAEQGEHAEAWCYMGFMLETGQGMASDFKEAIECFRRAAELGNDVAYSRLVELNVGK